ncbi:MAG: hypothetical protein FLDDKLPJ_00574 [Phycisphaerae bacterium]|nr:hypothetical protein [Phycisphaerae bacterium]
MIALQTRRSAISGFVLALAAGLIATEARGGPMRQPPHRGPGDDVHPGVRVSVPDDGGQEPAGCPLIPPCEQLTGFKAKCRLGVLGRLIVKVKLVPPGPGPDLSVLFGVNGQPFCTPFNRRNVAKLKLDNRVGPQFCEVLDPPRCFAPIQVDCGG